MINFYYRGYIMGKRNITITLDQAKEWFNSENKQLKELALQVFDIDELANDFRCITTFKKACEVLGYDYNHMVDIDKTLLSRSTSAMFRLNIVRRALNLGYDMQLAKNPPKSYIYHPFNPFVVKTKDYEKELNPDIVEIIGEIRTEGVSYYVLNSVAYFNGIDGIGNFNYSTGSGRAIADSGFLGCSTREIANHFGKYFGMLITTAKYADIIKDFEIIESKYII